MWKTWTHTARTGTHMLRCLFPTQVLTRSGSTDPAFKRSQPVKALRQVAKDFITAAAFAPATG